MSDVACNTVEESNGILNAYSAPTGMRNDGPPSYSIFYDPERIDHDDVADALRDAVEQHHTSGVYLDTSRSTPDEPHRANVALDAENENYPSLNALVYVHEDASDLEDAAEDLDDLAFWNMEWNAESGRDIVDDPRYLTENPGAGVLAIFFELENDDRYDAAVEMIQNTVYPKTVEVSQADSDGFYVHVKHD